MKAELRAGSSVLDLMQILDRAVDGIVIIDHQNTVIYFNAAAEAIWGSAAGDVVGRNVRILVPPEHGEHHDSLIERHRVNGDDRLVGQSRDLRMTRADGSTGWVSLSLAKTVDDAGRISYLATVKDVTGQRDAHRQAETAIGELGTAHHRVRDYSATVRELAERTHLLAINASIEASRSGVRGAAFGVVATEMRALAERTNTAATDITGLLDETGGRLDIVRDRIGEMRRG